jgi:PEP-CTERM motif
MKAIKSFRLIAATVLVTALTAVASAQSNNGNNNNNSNGRNPNRVVQVPEPETLLLFGGGLIVAFLVGRRRQLSKSKSDLP